MGSRRNCRVVWAVVARGGGSLVSVGMGVMARASRRLEGEYEEDGEGDGVGCWVLGVVEGGTV